MQILTCFMIGISYCVSEYKSHNPKVTIKQKTPTLTFFQIVYLNQTQNLKMVFLEQVYFTVIHSGLW